jgi:hypothetical protein
LLPHKTTVASSWIWLLTRKKAVGNMG